MPTPSRWRRGRNILCRAERGPKPDFPVTGIFCFPQIEAPWGAEEGSEAGDRLDVLVTLVETYENRRWPVEALDPVRAIEAAMETNGHTLAELAALIGQSRATEILNRQRALTLPMIRKIAGAWRVPEKVLVRDYALAKG